MKFLTTITLFSLSIGAFAGDVSNCSKLKLAGSYRCEIEGAKLELKIQKKNNVLVVNATSENEAFIIDGTLRSRYNWTTDYAYTSSCSQTDLRIDSLTRGELDAVIVMRPFQGGLEYSITKGGQTLALNCKKL